jgi:hypothetical protein
MSPTLEEQIEQLKTTIIDMEAQRFALGDEVVDATLAPLQRKLDELDGNLPQWDPGGVMLTHKSGNEWEITLSGLEGTEIEYKYTLGSWDFVEKGASCEEIANRTLILQYGTDGNQIVNDTVLNWRGLGSCPLN